MEILDNKKDKNGENKKKRINARVYKEWHITQAKKSKGLISSTFESKNQKLQESGSMEGRDSQGHKKKQRIDPDANSQQLGNGEEIPGVPEASSSTDILSCEIKHAEMVKDGALGSKQASSPIDVSCEIKHGDVLKDGTLGCKQKSEDLPDSKTKVPRYIEYWVPVGLSYVQLEQYCEILIKNSNLLCSFVKNDLLDSLHEVLTTIKKCCDHPYLVDSSLQKFVNEGRPCGDYLSNGIEVSGKLLLLDKLLQEVKEKQLRVLIVFQSNSSKSESINLQHIIDDLICQKIGEECYTHIYREFDSSKKRAEVDLFNDKESRKLVMLIEKSSCSLSIKLSSMDCVILFNSDWSPTNDMKPLRKMSIQSKFDHLKVLRLYSSNSVEEKALTLAKESVTLENSLEFFSYNTSHNLLLWGTSYLFSKLDDLHRRCSSIADMNSLYEDRLVSDVYNELTALLSCQDSDNISCSLISKVPETHADCSQKIALRGEQNEPARDDDMPPFTIWNSLLEGRNPLWKLLPGSAEKIRRRCEPLPSPAQCAEYDNHDAKRKRSPHSGDKFLCPKPRVGKVSRPASHKRAHNIAGYPKSRGNAVRSSSCREDSSIPRQIEEICLRRMRNLILKQKKQIREFYRTKAEDKKLEDEHQVEVNLMNQKYKETTTLKQHQLRKLDLIYEQKLDEHNHQMDTKRKELESQHLASRVKEKQLKDKLFSLLKAKKLKTLTTLLVKLAPKTALTQQLADVTEDSSNSTVMISNASVSESNHSQEIEWGMIDASVQRVDPGSFLDRELADTKNLYVECDEENQTMSMPREEVSDTAESGTTANVAGQQRIKEVQDGDCNIKASTTESKREAEMKGSPTLDVSATVAGQQSVEEVCGRDCNVEAIVREHVEVELRGAADLVTTATLAAQQRIEEVQDLDSNTDALNVESNGEADSRGAAGSGTTAIVAAQKRIEVVQEGDFSTDAFNWVSNEEVEATVFAQQRIEKVQNGDCNTGALSGESNGKTEFKGALESGITANVTAQPRIEKVLDGDCDTNALVGESSVEVRPRGTANSSTATVAEQQRMEGVQGGDHNIEAPIGASNGETVMRGTVGTTVTVLGQQRMEEPTELVSSRLDVSCEVSVQPQTCAISGYSSPLEQPISENLPCFGASAVSNCQTSSVHIPCEQGLTQVPLGTSGSYDQPVLQSQLQSSACQGQPHINSGMAIINRPISTYFEESSSLRSRLPPSIVSDPLEIELLRLKMEVQEAVKVNEDKKMHLRSACEKEIQEIQKKYDVLLMEAENALLQNKQELGSHFDKIKANQLLADTLKSSQKPATSPIPPEDLLNAILQLSRFNLPVQTSGVASAAQTSPPVQVVNQLSELVTFDAATPRSISTSLNTGNPLVGYHARSVAPNLSPQPRPETPSSTLNMLTSFYGVPNQQTASWPHVSVPSCHQPVVLPAYPYQFSGLPPNPLLL